MSHGPDFTCGLTYLFSCRSVVQTDEKLAISASWAKDDDITRLLKSLPNWLNMTQPKQLRPKREDEEDFIRYVSLKFLVTFQGVRDSDRPSLMFVAHAIIQTPRKQLNTQQTYKQHMEDVLFTKDFVDCF